MTADQSARPGAGSQRGQRTRPGPGTRLARAGLATVRGTLARIRSGLAATRSMLAAARAALAAALLGAGALTWAALPMSGASAGARPALIVAAGCAVLSVAQLADRILANRPQSEQRWAAAYVPPGVRLWQRILRACRITPWPEGMIIAALAVEALHRSRPWHTAVLGVVLLSWLLATHLAETAAGPTVFGPHLPLIAAGLGLLALSVGAAALPSSGLGGVATWLAVLGAVAAVIAAALTLPV